MLEGKGTVWKASKRGGHVVYIPYGVITDSAYPFKHKDKLKIRINPETKSLTIMKEENDERH